ncbi:MAG: GAF domain-containing protein [Moraxellaceae bacterium]|nr:GAF domain-containing protein [Moraxellaceae bacterium]
MADSALTLFGVRRMLEGVVPPTMVSVGEDGTPHTNYLSLAEYVDAEHLALSFQFFNQSRKNVLATRRIALSLDDPYTGAGVVLQAEYVRTETSGPVFERLRAKLAGVASHSGMEAVFVLRGADVFRVLEMRYVPGRKELPAALPRCDLAAGARAVSESLAACGDLGDLVDAMMCGLAEQLRIEHAMLWMLEPSCEAMTLLASHGYPERATGAELPLGDGLAGIAAREGVPVRIGHIAQMRIYGRAVRERASQLGLDPLCNAEIPLPGLAEPRSQMAVPLRAMGRVIGVLFVESEHNQFFGYDDEDALMLLCGQFAMSLDRLRAIGEAEAEVPAPVVPAQSGQALRVRRFSQDNSIFLNDDYLIKGVAGAIFWKLVRDYTREQRSEFTTRELRLAGTELRLPDLQDNLDVRLLLLQRRLAERDAPVRIEKTGRGRFRLCVACSLQLIDEMR